MNAITTACFFAMSYRRNLLMIFLSLFVGLFAFLSYLCKNLIFLTNTD